MEIDLFPYGPWREVPRTRAARTRPTGDGRPFVLTIFDDGTAETGYRFVNAESHWRSARPLPPDLVCACVWYDEDGMPAGVEVI